MKTVEIKNFSNPIDAEKRRKYLQNIEKFADTDTLEILSNAASKPGVNKKAKQFKSFL